MTTFALPFNGFMSYRNTDTAVSTPAQKIRKAWAEIKDATNESIYLAGWRHDLKNMILDIAEECKIANWDEEGADPISPITVSFAVKFIDQLPETILAPSVGPSNEGGYVFDWMADRDLVFSVTLLNDYVIFAGIFGSDRFSGKVKIQDELSEQIAQLLEKFFKEYK